MVQKNTSRNESNGAMSVLSGKIQTKGAIPMNLSTISTAELVKELSKREAVQKNDCGAVSILSNNGRKTYRFRYRSCCYFKDMGLIFVMGYFYIE